jgi:hypothetical protein
MTPASESMLQPKALPSIDQTIVRDEGVIVAQAIDVELPSAQIISGEKVTSSTFTTSICPWA